MAWLVAAVGFAFQKLPQIREMSGLTCRKYLGSYKIFLLEVRGLTSVEVPVPGCRMAMSR